MHNAKCIKRIMHNGVSACMMGASKSLESHCLVSPGMLLSSSSSTSLQVLLSISSHQVVTKWSPSGHQVVTKWTPGGYQVVTKWYLLLDQLSIALVVHYLQAIVESSNANFNLTKLLSVRVYSAYRDFLRVSIALMIIYQKNL